MAALDGVSSPVIADWLWELVHCIDKETKIWYSLLSVVTNNTVINFSLLSHNDLITSPTKDWLVMTLLSEKKKQINIFDIMDLPLEKNLALNTVSQVYKE